MSFDIYGLLNVALLAAATEGTAAPGAPPAGPAINPLFQQMPFIVMMVAVVYFMFLRPTQKRDQQRRQMLTALKKGDRVVTSGGICGTVMHLSDTHAVVRVSEEPIQKIEFVREAIARVLPAESTGEAKQKD